MVSPADSDRSGSAETARLRADIDSGRTGDKVAMSDPAAAPLGTDDEAAGTPPPGHAMAAARAAEARPAAAHPTIAASATKPAEQWGALLVAGVVTVVAVCLLVAVVAAVSGHL